MKSGIAVALLAGMVLTFFGCRASLPRAIPQPQPRTVTLLWDASPSPEVDRYEIWTSTDLRTWSHKTNVTGTAWAVTAGQPVEYFMVRARTTNGLVSAWAVTQR